MKQDDFYNAFPTLVLRDDQQTKQQRLIKDLRENDFSWEQMHTVFEQMENSSWKNDWNIFREEQAQ
jgi:hypothetical protein